MDLLEQYFNQQNTDQLLGDETLLRRDLAYERIKDALQHANLQPGTALSESKLSKMLGISRTPIRESLRQLASEGLVQVIPGQAVTVASRSLPDVLNVVHMRYLLEPEMARLVAKSATDETVHALQAAIQQMDDALRANDAKAWSHANSDYHQAMSDACPNQLLGETVLQMWNRVHHLAQSDSKSNPDRLAACTGEHKQIVKAIADRDPAAAEAAMREHIEALRASLFQSLSYGN
jgi:DNA-binding GntR family transcriptional regulator